MTETRAIIIFRGSHLFSERKNHLGFAARWKAQSSSFFDSSSLGWQPKIDLETGIRLAFEAARPILDRNMDVTAQ